MTITVATDITTTPPRNTVTVNSGAGTVMSSVSLWRNDASGQTLLRTQPSAGFASQFVFDYECPYGVATTYGWTANYGTPSTVIFDEVWTSIAAWTVSGTPWTVASGNANGPAITSASHSNLSRSFTSGAYRLTVASMSNSSTSALQLNLQQPGGSTLQLNLIGTTFYIWWPGASTSTPTTIDSTQPITVDYGSASVTVTGTGGSYTQPFTSPTFNGVVILASTTTTVAAGAMKIGEVKVQAYGTSSTITETSAAVTLAPLYGWMVHPIVPALSCKLGFNGSRIMTISTLDTITDPSNSTLHYILGSKTPIATTTGPRSGEVRSATIKVTTATEESALKAMLADETPILFNIAPSFGIQLGWGFYQVGDVSRDRQAQRPNWAGRYITLPLTAVQPPIAAVQNSGWSWAALALAFPTWASLKLAFNTWADVAANNRNPGY